MTGSLDEVGWVDEVTVNQRTGLVVDGHLRAALAISRGEQQVPTKYVDLSEAEEALILDFDPYGEPWPVMDAFFQGLRPSVQRLVLVVNDGLRQKLKMNGGWTVGSLHSVVDRIGNGALYERYLGVCKHLVKEKAARAGYTLCRWTGYYCGFADQMTHYAAVLERT